MVTLPSTSSERELGLTVNIPAFNNANDSFVIVYLRNDSTFISYIISMLTYKVIYMMKSKSRFKMGVNSIYIPNIYIH